MKARKSTKARNHRYFRYRLEPTEDQIHYFHRVFGCCRFVWNKMLEDKIAYYQENKKMLKNTPAQYKKEFPFLKEVDAQALCHVQMHLESAFKNFFLSPKFGFPKWKSKKREQRSYTTSSASIKVMKDKVFLPIIKEVKAIIHRPIPGGWVLKAITVIQEPSGEFYASCLFEFDKQEIKKKVPEKFIGLDFGMKHLFTTSDGELVDMPGFHQKMLEKLAREQRKIAKMEQGSSNWQKQKLKIARIYQKVKNQRKDFQHKLSLQLAKTYDCIAIEDIRVLELIEDKQNRCWTNAQKRAANLKIMDLAWGQFTHFLQYKLEERGKILFVVNRYYPSSQICSVCGKQNAELKDLDIREWTCPECGSTLSRDINAAINLRNQAMINLL